MHIHQKPLVSLCHRSFFLFCHILLVLLHLSVPPLIGQMSDRILTHDHVDNVKGEDVDGEQGEGHGEQVEVSVVPLAHTVAHPWTVVIKAVCEKDRRVTV